MTEKIVTQFLNSEEAKTAIGNLSTHLTYPAWMERPGYERIARDDPKPIYGDISFGYIDTLEDLRKMYEGIDFMMDTGQWTSFSLSGDYDGELVAHFKTFGKYTPEEIENAKKWLEEHPESDDPPNKGE